MAAAYELTNGGHYAQVFERAPFLGGQASTFPVGGGELERGYHHLFVSDTDMTALIHELGLGDKLAWLESKVGLFHDGKVWDFATPMDLLRFKPLSLPQRLRVGMWTFFLQKTKDWRKFESITAQDWIVRHMGQRAYQVIWEPLLRGKFGEFYDQVSKRSISTAFPRSMDGLVVLEGKIPVGREPELKNLFFPFAPRATRCSKYVHGCTKLGFITSEEE